MFLPNENMQVNTNVAGFTLIEMMVTIVLGSLITAAALQMLFTAQNTLNNQQSVTDLGEGQFGLQKLDFSLKHVALNNDEDAGPINTDVTMRSGVVVTTDENGSVTVNRTPNNLNGVIDYKETSIGKSISKRLISHSVDDGTSYDNLSNVDVKSDQLTIQYTLPQEGTNCEGHNVPDGNTVIERYFIGVDNTTTDKSTDPVKSYALRCDASYYDARRGEGDEFIYSVAEGKKIPNPIYKSSRNVDAYTIPLVESFGDVGQVLVPRADYLKVLLGVKRLDASENTKIGFMTVKDYMKLTPTKNEKDQMARPPIVAIQVGILARSVQNTSNKATEAKTKYSILGSEVLLNNATDTKNQYTRRVYVYSSLLKNALVGSE